MLNNDKVGRRSPVLTEGQRDDVGKMCNVDSLGIDELANLFSVSLDTIGRA